MEGTIVLPLCFPMWVVDGTFKGLLGLCKIKSVVSVYLKAIYESAIPSIWDSLCPDAEVLNKPL